MIQRGKGTEVPWNASSRYLGAGPCSQLGGSLGVAPKALCPMEETATQGQAEV